MSETNPSIEESAWYIVYTKPRAEKKLSELLKKYHLENYLPIRKERKKWTDRFKWIHVPVLPSYIFVKIVFWRDKNKVLQLPGSHHFVFHKGQPATVSQDDLDILELGLQKYADSLTTSPESVLEKGKRVRIIGGAYVGKTMEVIEIKNKTKVILRIPEINTAFVYQVNVGDLAWEELII
ncbi:transcription antitermination factor NusG [Leptospira meyeri]|uniref:Transcription antitermination factor NusG n=1 Tax=Leptospira meyeri TaxID=29508 RepID=A0A4R8MV65_LEPME|nr:UpxY family transcription antiterminator [Leptospira meyeri]EKJ88306.1 transcription termination/antitermination factor NusG [Leptospira meyeri serovar Hardjo str. Went 5]TDY73293.1 transcription antitermination factor NusG [Leptospira meyeri]TGL49769.1 UpxY family transcription antiterminator [Leptospira meyeri]